MEFKFLFLAYQVICAILFLEILIRLRKNPWLKTCLLFILASLFIMNYFSYITVSTRLDFFIVKCARLAYASSAMFIIVRLATDKIPVWITTFILIAIFFMVGLRIGFYQNVNIEAPPGPGGQIFTVGPEFYTPMPYVRYAVFLLAGLLSTFTFYYYRLFFLKMNKDNTSHRKLSNWLIMTVIPVFLLVIFGILGTLKIFHASLSSYLFSFFSGMVILSVLFRPKFLNTSPYRIDPPQAHE